MKLIWYCFDTALKLLCNCSEKGESYDGGFHYGEVNIENGAEDVRHGGVGERIDGDDVKMAQTSRRYFLAAPTRRTHRRPQLHVFDFQRRRFFTIVPVKQCSF